MPSLRKVRLHRMERLDDRRMLAVITVTDLGDGALAALAGDGKISLREAIEAVNLQSSVDGSPAGDGTDLIRFDPALFADGPRTLKLTSLHESDATQGMTSLRLSASASIVGPGATQLTIVGLVGEDPSTPISRIFRVDDGNANSIVTSSMSGMTLRGGELNIFDGAAHSEPRESVARRLGRLRERRPQWRRD